MLFIVSETYDDVLFLFPLFLWDQINICCPSSDLYYNVDHFVKSSNKCISFKIKLHLLKESYLKQWQADVFGQFCSYYSALLKRITWTFLNTKRVDVANFSGF